MLLSLKVYGWIALLFWSLSHLTSDALAGLKEGCFINSYFSEICEKDSNILYYPFLKEGPQPAKLVQIQKVFSPKKILVHVYFPTHEERTVTDRDLHKAVPSIMNGSIVQGSTVLLLNNTLSVVHGVFDGGHALIQKSQYPGQMHAVHQEVLTPPVQLSSFLRHYRVYFLSNINTYAKPVVQFANGLILFSSEESQSLVHVDEVQKTLAPTRAPAPHHHSYLFQYEDSFSEDN